MSSTRRRPGALEDHVDRFGEYLHQRGYTPGTVRGQLKVLGRLGRWMQEQDLLPEMLSAATVEAFMVAEGPRGQHRSDRRTAMLVLEYLIDAGIVAPAPQEPVSELAVLLADFREWMVSERGLAETTIIRYENTARRFLAGRDDHEGVAAGVSSVEVNAFLLVESSRASVGAAKGRVAELRALLRYLHLRGLTPTSLAVAVPPVAGWHNTGIPPNVTATHVQALVDSCDRSTVVGRRDFAIITLVARLGLRSIEIARMELEDINWRTGNLIVRGKARRLDTMPLDAESGHALVEYLQHGRPQVPSWQRKVFLTARAPIGPIRADLVGDVVERACRRVGIDTVGPHRLRHALARRLLSEGASLSDISQVLRHRDLATTALYAKVDLDALRKVAKPWPVPASTITQATRS